MDGDTARSEGARSARMAAAEGLNQLEAEVGRCHERLEITHDSRREGGKWIESPIPMSERAAAIDGIESRDATIKLLESAIDVMRRR